MQNLDRRSFIRNGLLLTGAGALASFDFPYSIRHLLPSFSIGACDWSLGKTSDLDAFRIAKEIGLDGVQVSLGTAKNNMHLRQPIIQQAFLEASQTTGVKISSMGIGELNNIPYKSESITQEWVSDSIDVARLLGCQVILLAFFHNGDLRDDPIGKKEVIRKLREVAPKAEKQNIYLAIESWLSAEEHLEIIEAVGSSHVRVYYDVANATEMGYDIFHELKLLGPQYICEIHMKENGQLLGQGKVDFSRLKGTLEDIGYKNWLIIEGAIPSGQQLLPSYQYNRRFLDQLMNV
jgi:L-ribulose-5-phosphate 3-epimerase